MKEDKIDKLKEEPKKAKSAVDAMIGQLEKFIVENDGKSDNGTTAKAILAERKMILKFLKEDVKK